MAKFAVNTDYIKELGEWLQKLGIDPNSVHRIIIDLQADDVARIYTFGYANTKMLEIEPPRILKEAIIKSV